MNKDDLLKELYDIIKDVVRDKSQLQTYDVFRARNIQKKDKDIEQELVVARKLFRKAK